VSSERDDGAGFLGQTTGGLLLWPSLQKELKLSTEQLGKIRPLLAKVRQKYREPFDNIQEIKPKDYLEKWSALEKLVSQEVHKGLANILRPEQHKRLRQIELQLSWLYGFFDPDVQKILKLTKKQQQSIKTIRMNFAGEVKFVLIPPPSSPIGPMLKAAMEQAVAILRADQKKAWEELLGEPFELK
jgi:hypothetical protein